MSEDAAVSRKEKRAQRDAERHKGSKKRKREEDAPEQTQQAEHQQDFIPLAGDAAVEAEVEAQLKAQAKADPTARKLIKRPKASSRRKIEAARDAEDDQQPKAKKPRKAKSSDEQQLEDQPYNEAATANPAASKTRFILFIGNLPYSTTDASLQNYFKSILPFTLRHRTDPKTKKSKGFAFLEFENYDRMQTCIKLYHHSMFNPDSHAGNSAEGGEVKQKTKDRGARRINVELTAGGGGSKEGRMEKIKAKNVKLDEQRKRKAEAERKEKEKEALKEGKGEKKAKDGGGRKKGQLGAARVDAQLQERHTVKGEDTSHVHPSRLARVTG